jgi:hypothetical protein
VKTEEPLREHQAIRKENKAEGFSDIPSRQTSHQEGHFYAVNHIRKTTRKE